MSKQALPSDHYSDKVLNLQYERYVLYNIKVNDYINSCVNSFRDVMFGFTTMSHLATVRHCLNAHDNVYSMSTQDRLQALQPKALWIHFWHQHSGAIRPNLLFAQYVSLFSCNKKLGLQLEAYTELVCLTCVSDAQIAIPACDTTTAPLCVQSRGVKGQLSEILLCPVAKRSSANLYPVKFKTAMKLSDTLTDLMELWNTRHCWHDSHV